MRRITERADPMFFLGVFAILFAFFFLPIALANRYCNDDIIRSILGHYGWSNAGRHLAEPMMRGLALASSRTIDISPVPQLLALALLSWTAVLLRRRFDLPYTLLGALIILPIAAQPFFLENLAYRFDSVPMATSILFALLPITSIGRNRLGWILGVLSLLAAFNFYQPAFNTFLVMVVFEIIYAQVTHQPISTQLQLVGFRAAQALCVALIYKLLFAPKLSGWMKTHGATISLGDPASVGVNAKSFFVYVINALGPKGTFLFGVFLIVPLTIVLILSLGNAYVGRSTRRAWETSYLVASAVLLPCAALACVVGPMVFLQQPVFMPRVFVAFGVLLSGALIVSNKSLPETPFSQHAQTFGCSCLILLCAIIAGSFGSASADQRRYEEGIAMSLADDLAAAQSKQSITGFVLEGTAGFSPTVDHMVKIFPVLEKLVNPYLIEDDFNTHYFLLHFIQGVPQFANSELSAEQTESVASTRCATSFDTARAAYRINVLHGLAVVRFADHWSDCPKPH